MAGLEIKRLKLELTRVRASKAEMEFQIEERLDEIDRVRKNIQIQVQREQELVKLIQDVEAKEGK